MKHTVVQVYRMIIYQDDMNPVAVNNRLRRLSEQYPHTLIYFQLRDKDKEKTLITDTAYPSQPF